MSEKALEVIVSDGQARNKKALEKAAKLLSEIPNGYEAAVSRAMNRAATSGRSAAVSTIRQEYTIKASTVRRNSSIEKATRSSLEALVTSKGPRIPLVNYKTRPKTDTTGNKRKPVRVAVKARGGLKPLGKAFVYRGRILQRLDTRSLPVQEVYGPAIPVLSENNEVVDNVEKTMRETFFKRLDHETSQLLGGGVCGKAKISGEVVYMVENELTRAIRELVSEAVKNFALPTKPDRGFAEGELRVPKVVNGYLPPKRSGQDDDFPFVLVRADEGATDQDSTEVQVSIIVGAYSEEYDGHEYCLNVMSRIRTALCSLPGMTLANRYRLQHPIKWSTYAEQPYPYWQLDMQTTWDIHTPQPIDQEEDF